MKGKPILILHTFVLHIHIASIPTICEHVLKDICSTLTHTHTLKYIYLSHSCDAVVRHRANERRSPRRTKKQRKILKYVPQSLLHWVAFRFIFCSRGRKYAWARRCAHFCRADPCCSWGTTYWITFLSIYSMCISLNNPVENATALAERVHGLDSDRTNDHSKRNRRQSARHTALVNGAAHTHTHRIDSAICEVLWKQLERENIKRCDFERRIGPGLCDRHRTRGMQIGEMIMSWINMFSISPTMGLSLVCAALVSWKEPWQLLRFNVSAPPHRATGWAGSIANAFEAIQWNWFKVNANGVQSHCKQSRLCGKLISSNFTAQLCSFDRNA